MMKAPDLFIFRGIVLACSKLASCDIEQRLCHNCSYRFVWKRTFVHAFNFVVLVRVTSFPQQGLRAQFLSRSWLEWSITQSVIFLSICPLRYRRLVVLSYRTSHQWCLSIVFWCQRYRDSSRDYRDDRQDYTSGYRHGSGSNRDRDYNRDRCIYTTISLSSVNRIYYFWFVVCPSVYPGRFK